MPTPHKASVPPSADDIIAAIKSMPIADRKRFLKMLERSHRAISEGGFSLVPTSVLDTVTDVSHGLVEQLKNMVAFAVKMSKEADSASKTVEDAEDRYAEVMQQLDIAIKTIAELNAKLQKHRRPKKNAERDVEIMRLYADGNGKTAGEIVILLRDRWKLTDNIVTAVISRERAKKRAI